jgi:iron complex outermembrane receptor protein
VPDPREATVNRRTYLGGLPEIEEIKLAQTLSLPTASGEIYSDGTFALREARVGQAGRKPNTNQNIVAIFPDGFTPFYTLEEIDFQLTGGFRADLGTWKFDLSSTFGRNDVDNGADNTLNASLGAASPTSFDTFASQFDQWTTNVDLTRRLELAAGSALQVSLGGELRHESYETRPLDVDSYRNGGYFYPVGTPSLAGRPAQVGAQGAIVVTPEDAADISRKIFAGYVDFAWDVSEQLLLTAAGRFEDYDDSSGSVVSGKVSGRSEQRFSRPLARATSLCADFDQHQPGRWRLRSCANQGGEDRIVDRQCTRRRASRPGALHELQRRLHADAVWQPVDRRRCLPDRS